MSTTDPMAKSAATAPTPYWQFPTLSRDRRVVGGVASGLADELGLEPLDVRIGFVGLLIVGGWGGWIYLVLWSVLGLLEFNGQSYRQASHIPKGRTENRRRLGFALIVLGLMSIASQLPGVPFVILGPVGGVILVAAVISAPWWWQMVRELDKERQARVRADERADVAAHLHDSVLQTLSLIQRHADDPQTMVNLARRQERELRNWLDPNRVSRDGQSLRGQLDSIATDVEDFFAVPVEIVVSGDALIDDSVEALLGATREAAVNAAKHSGADQIDIYAEARPARIEIFIRDQGIGFDRDSIPTDRRGLTESVHGRMTRVGGSAHITSTPGEGTEVELRLPRIPSPTDATRTAEP